MKLGTLIDRLPNGLDDSLCIFAAKPWSANSSAAAVQLDDGFRPPKEVIDQGLVYFLEVHVANETLEVFGDHAPTEAEKRDLLIFYAENDAFPEWVYTR
jgi:regulator of sirC expression with transglutaminase-like and TPR domain